MNRMETGQVRFGEDWCGVFIRGDEALGLAMQLEYEQPKARENILLILRSCDEGGEDTRRLAPNLLMPDEVDALREKLAAAERDRDEAQGRYERQCAGTWSRESALAASQAEASALRAAWQALVDSYALGKQDHERRDAFERAKSLLAAPASTDALREFGVRVGTEAWLAGLSDGVQDASYWCSGTAPDRAAVAAVTVPAIVARVLAQPDAGQPEGEA